MSTNPSEQKTSAEKAADWLIGNVKPMPLGDELIPVPYNLLEAMMGDIDSYLDLLVERDNDTQIEQTEQRQKEMRQIINRHQGNGEA